MADIEWTDMKDDPGIGKAANGPFDRSAAVTRSLLGYGVIAGPIYLMVGLVQALLRDGFELSEHSLSLLTNGPWGWVQVTNLIVAGLMATAAGVGFDRALRPAGLVGRLIAVYGVGLIVAGLFRADPMAGFPPGTPDGAPENVSAAGAVHLVAGGLGFIALIASYVILARWFAQQDQPRLALGSRISALAIGVGFAVGAATATTALGVAALWVAVVAGWGWLSVASVAVYRTVPHPDVERRTAGRT